jgi:hypothetical protein
VTNELGGNEITTVFIYEWIYSYREGSELRRSYRTVGTWGLQSEEQQVLPI